MMTTRLALSGFWTLAATCPLLALGSLGWAFVGGGGFGIFLLRFLLFWVCGFAGLWALGAAREAQARLKAQNRQRGIRR